MRPCSFSVVCLVLASQASAQPVWTERATASNPPARRAFGMAWDGGGAEFVVFGGVGSASLGDTWAWDGSGWIERTPSSCSTPTFCPSARSQPAMFYDPASDWTVREQWDPGSC